MKKLTVALSAGLLFIGISIAMAQNKPVAFETKGQLEQYVSKGLLTLKMGSQMDKTTFADYEKIERKIMTKDEFGYIEYINSPTGMPLGPNAVAVDKNEDIYILDSINKRIVIFNEKGEYKESIDIKMLDENCQINSQENIDMSIDSRGYVYILCPYLPEGTCILKINKNGEVKQGYIDASKIKKYAKSPEKNKKLLDDIEKRRDFYILPENVDEIRETLFKDSEDNVYVLSGKGKYLNISTETLEPKEQLPGDISSNLNNIYTREPMIINKRKPEQIKEILVKSLDGTIKNKIQFQIPSKYKNKRLELFDAKVIGEDMFGNKYITLALAEAQNKHNVSVPLIYKYSKNWALLSIIEIENQMQNQVWYHKPIVSRSGNIYKLVWDTNKISEGEKLIKW